MGLLPFFEEICLREKWNSSSPGDVFTEFFLPLDLKGTLFLAPERKMVEVFTILATCKLSRVLALDSRQLSAVSVNF